MPMEFPDMESLITVAEVHKFRDPLLGEAEEEYRHLLANHVRPIDFIESEEIRNKVGWNQFSEAQNMAMLRRCMKMTIR